MIGWMSIGQCSFRDPDSHSLEFIARFPRDCQPGFAGSLSEGMRDLGQAGLPAPFHD